MWLSDWSEFHLKSLIGITIAVKDVSYNLQSIIVYFLNDLVLITINVLTDELVYLYHIGQLIIL